ncbi:MAG: hypothetical protein ACTSWN_00690 [Promethearchaeota archaeon]
MKKQDNKIGFFHLDSLKSRIRYFFVSLLLVIGLRMLENTVHELSHGVTAILVGGGLRDDPFLITPFGGYTRWRDVPAEWLPLVNIIGSLAATTMIITIFVPLWIKSSRNAVRFIGYWGIVILVNVTFYWFMSPFIGTATHYDPIAFARNLQIEPVWVIGLCSAIPFFFSVYAMIMATKKLYRIILTDLKRFHVVCLLIYYAISITFPVVSYLNLLDRFAWW